MAAVDEHRGSRRSATSRSSTPLGIGQGVQVCSALADQAGEVDRSLVEPDRVGVVRREDEQVLDQVPQPDGVALDDRQTLRRHPEAAVPMPPSDITSR